jgi:hypothetical protein
MAVWYTFPNDPIGVEGPREYEEFIACRNAGMSRMLVVYGLLVAWIVVTIRQDKVYKARIEQWRRTHNPYLLVRAPEEPGRGRKSRRPDTKQ